jgi:SAM-dependent methyltransferase
LVIDHIFQLLRQQFRRRRYQNLHNRLGLAAQTGFVLDLGGGVTSFFINFFPQHDQIILLDINPEEVCLARQRFPHINGVVANGEHLPFARNSLGLTVCNSLIEHVAAPAQLAAEIERVSRAYFVQTPNGRFPLETHAFIAIPFYRWLPGERVRRLACTLFRADYAYVSSVCYLSEAILRQLFPKATLTYERFLGLKKSFYLFAK